LPYNQISKPFNWKCLSLGQTLNDDIPIIYPSTDTISHNTK